MNTTLTKAEADAVATACYLLNTLMDSITINKNIGNTININKQAEFI